MLQPLIVRKNTTNPTGYEIVAGERRWRAAQIAKLHELPVLVRDYDDDEVLEIAIIENVQRADLNPIEEAAGYRHKISVLAARSVPAHETMPRVHKVASLLKRWLLGTHQGGIQHQHLDYYLDEFTFRFNRRRSNARGLLFHRLAEQVCGMVFHYIQSLSRCHCLPPS